jgi:hypothetical protein
VAADGAVSWIVVFDSFGVASLEFAVLFDTGYHFMIVSLDLLLQVLGRLFLTFGMIPRRWSSSYVHLIHPPVFLTSFDVKNIFFDANFTSVTAVTKVQCVKSLQKEPKKQKSYCELSSDILKRQLGPFNIPTTVNKKTKRTSRGSTGI